MLSVVIPLYNKEHTILRTIYSVITQTYADFEVIVVDDGSKDAGARLLAEHVHDGRIRIVRQENQGVSAARNRGVAESQYEYIAFLDADDEWLPTYLEKVVEAISLHPDAGIFCTPGLHRNLMTGQGRYFIANEYRGKIAEMDYFREPKVLGGQTSGVVVAKNAFERLQSDYEGGGFPVGLNLNEDWACFQSIALISQAVYIGFSLTIRNTHVVGQLVDLEDDGLDMRLNKTPKYLNITLRNYLKLGQCNHSFERYRKYEIRSLVSFFFRMRHHKAHLSTFIENLDPAHSRLLLPNEFKFYSAAPRSIALLFIFSTKLKFWLETKCYSTT